MTRCYGFRLPLSLQPRLDAAVRGESPAPSISANSCCGATSGLIRPQDITKPILERYQRYLFLYRKEDGQPLTTRSQHTRITPLRAFFKWLARQNHILYNPASELGLPRLERRLPKHVLTIREAETVLAQPDLGTSTASATAPCWRPCTAPACAAWS